VFHVFPCGSLCRQQALLAQCGYIRCDPSFNGWCVLLACIKFLGERAVIADKEGVDTDSHGVALQVKFGCVSDFHVMHFCW
jgi:hypothetical protein